MKEDSCWLKAPAGSLSAWGLIIVFTLGAALAETAAEPTPSQGGEKAVGGVLTAIQVQFLNPLITKENFYLGEVWALSQV